EHVLEDLLHRLLGPIAPVAANGQVDANFIVGIVAGADLIVVGASQDLDASLEAAIVAEGDGDARLDIDRPGAGLINEAGERRIGIKAFDDNVIVIAAERQIESEEHFQMLDLQCADAQVIRSQLEQELVEAKGIVEVGRVDVAADESLGFEANPAIAAVFAIFFKIEIAVVVAAELRHRG